MATKKGKRYADGGDVFEDTVSVNPEPEESKPETFGEAFKAARAAGEKTFEYKGKTYTTEVAGEKKAAPKSESKFTPGEAVGAKKSSLEDKGADLMRNLKTTPRAQPTKEEKIRSASGGGKYVPGAKPMKTGGKVSSASKRADGCAIRGKTRA